LRGLNFTKASTIARRTIFHSQTAFFLGFMGECPMRTDFTFGTVGS
jgi:hypothetical protein